MSRFIILLAILVWQIASFMIPLDPNVERCMIVYSLEDGDSVKLSIVFPQLLKIRKSEYQYQVQIKNNHLNLSKIALPQPGTYKDQIEIIKDLIYEICITVKIKKGISTLRVYEEILISYDANTHFLYDSDKLSALPDSARLMKTAELQKLTQSLILMQGVLKNQQKIQFQLKKNAENEIITYSIIQIALIILFGVIQFFRLRNKVQKDTSL